MPFLKIALGFFVAVVCTTFVAESATAQQRYYVSRNGTDDANCGPSLVPCQTISFTLSRLPAGTLGNKLVCVDVPPTATTITITRAVAIDCLGTGAHINSIVINAGPNDVVALRGVNVGFGTSTAGIAFNSGAGLTIEESTIRDVLNTAGIGVDLQPSTAATLTIVDSTILNNGTVQGGGGGLRVAPTASGSARAFLKNVTFANNHVGLAAIGSGNVAAIEVDDSTISNNLAFATYAAGTGAVVRLRNSSITGNGGAASIGNVQSYGDNRIAQNNPDTNPPNAGGLR